MFAYNLDLAWRSLRRNTALTALMAQAIGFDVASSMTTYAVFRAVSATPLPMISLLVAAAMLATRNVTGVAAVSRMGHRCGSRQSRMLAPALPAQESAIELARSVRNSRIVASSHKPIARLKAAAASSNRCMRLSRCAASAQ